MPIERKVTKTKMVAQQESEATTGLTVRPFFPFLGARDLSGEKGLKIFCRRRKEVQICTTSAAAAGLIFVVAAGMNSVVVAEHQWKKVSGDGVPISAFRNFPKDGASLSHIDLGEDGH